MTAKLPLKNALSAAEIFALDKAVADNRPIDKLLCADLPLVFGKKWADSFQLIRKRLLTVYGDDTRALLQLAIRLFDFAKWRGAYEMRQVTTLSGESIKEPSDSLSGVYLEINGLAMVAGDIVSATYKPHALLANTRFEEYPEEGDLLDALSLIWFFEAASMQLLRPQLALDQLYEASAVHRMAHGFYMWDAAPEIMGDSPAVAMAYLSHREHREMAEYVKSYWHTQIDSQMSAQKAADVIVKANIVTLSHKKIAEIISRLRREEGLR